jgi:predicted nuclease with TOPRIM domain
MIITFTLGFVAAGATGALIWNFVTLYKLKKKFNWMTDTWKDMMADQSRLHEMYYRTRDDDQNALYRRFDDLQRHIETNYVAKEDLKDNKKTLLKG